MAQEGKKEGEKERCQGTKESLHESLQPET
jgi:hypothetical protein